MNDNKIISAILSKNGIKIIQTLPRNEKQAISIRELGKKCKIPQTTIYRNIKPLLEWDNIGKMELPMINKTELYFYLKSDFIIKFKNGIFSLILIK